MGNSVKKRLLLVDDEMLIALGQAAVLEKNGFIVIQAENGEKAIETVTNDPDICVVLMDIDLGKGISGPEAAEEILKIRAVPIVFLTSYSDNSMVEKVRSINRYGYVIKDSGPSVLLSSIEMALELFEAHKKIEEKNRTLNEREIFFKKIFNTNPVLMSVSEIETGQFIEVNETFLNILGYERDEIIGKKSTDLNIWADNNDRVRAVSILQRDGYIRHFETQVHTKNMELRYGLFSIDFIDYNGHKCMLSAMTDITENKIARDAVLRSEEKYKNIFDQAIVGIASIALDGRFLEVNSRFSEITGYTADELLALKYMDITHPEDLTVLLKCSTDIIRDKTDSFTLEKRAVHKDRHILWIHLYCSVIRDDNRKIKSAIAVIDDVSSRKLAEIALEQSELHYHLLADHMSDAVWLMDMNLNTTYCSPSVEKMRGYTAEEIINMPIHEHLTENSLKKALNIFKTEKEKIYEDPGYSFVKNFNMELYKKDGSTIWTDCTFTLIRGKNGEPESILGEARDITEKKLAEDKISRLLAEKEILLKEVHHRIKNNMQTIASLLYIQSDSIKDISASAALNDAYNRVQSMMLIYDKLYRSADFREISAASYLNQLIDSIASTFKTSSEIEVIKKIENIAIRTEQLFPVGIIINELMTNSYKYAFPGKQKGSISISLERHDSDIEIYYKDNGIGIPEPLIRFESQGFGINLVKVLTEQLNSSLELFNSGGAGYKIKFSL